MSEQNNAPTAPATPAAKRPWVFSGATDVGRVRDHNEDAIFMDGDLKLVALADGMGGYQAGEVASRITVETVRDESAQVAADDKLLSKLDPATGLSVAMRLLRSAIEKANNRICGIAHDSSDLNGMGTTVVAARFYDGRIGIAHVGDSRCYRYREGQFTQLTRDHSLVEEQLAKGLITAEEARVSNQKNLITRALGIDALAVADVREYRTQPGDIYLLCSDGLSDMVPPEDFEEEFATARPADERVKRLIRLANKNGGRDNISVIIVEVGDPADADQWWLRFLKK